MSHNQKAESVLVELLFENWMTIPQWNDFLKKAQKKVGYCAEYLSSDIASPFKSDDFINNRLNEMKAFKIKHFAIS